MQHWTRGVYVFYRWCCSSGELGHTRRAASFPLPQARQQCELLSRWQVSLLVSTLLWHTHTPLCIFTHYGWVCDCLAMIWKHTHSPLWSMVWVCLHKNSQSLKHRRYWWLRLVHPLWSTYDYQSGLTGFAVCSWCVCVCVYVCVCVKQLSGYAVFS